MDFNFWIVLAPSLVAGFIGWMAGDHHGFACAVDHVKAMPITADLDLDTDGADGLLERARR